ncbi:MAG: ABC transporter permease [Anaerolineales bacterium]|nr:ABC transporter permease [Anaerolineales bacterium]
MSYIFNNPDIILKLLWEHIVLAIGALLIATVIAIPLGYYIHGKQKLTTVVLGILGTLYTIPSLVLMILLLPLFGLNATTVVVALVIYCQIILVRNVIAGLDAIEPGIMEAAQGMGMTRAQQFTQIQLPLILPVLIAGMRLSVVVATAIATVGAMFGAGGLGTLLFNGISQGRFDKIISGSLTVSLLAIVFNLSLQYLEKRLGKPLS